jgi:hypothetical protein
MAWQSLESGEDAGMTNTTEPPALASRQSQAPRIARGVLRHLARRGIAAVTEFTLPNGRRADLLALSASGELWIIEIKSSVEDFRADHKWPEYRPYCDRFFFATHLEMPMTIFPDSAGLIVADEFDAEVLRDCAVAALNAATRKSLLVQMAQLAAFRLTIALDSGFAGRF